MTDRLSPEELARLDGYVEYLGDKLFIDVDNADGTFAVATRDREARWAYFQLAARSRDLLAELKTLRLERDETQDELGRMEARHQDCIGSALYDEVIKENVACREALLAWLRPCDPSTEALNQAADTRGLLAIVEGMIVGLQSQAIRAGVNEARVENLEGEVADLEKERDTIRAHVAALEAQVAGLNLSFEGAVSNYEEELAKRLFAEERLKPSTPAIPETQDHGKATASPGDTSPPRGP